MSWPDFDAVLCCIRMLPLDIHYMTLLNTTLMVPNYIRGTITCANPHILSHERILFAVISTRNLLMQRQKLFFFRVNLILFYQTFHDLIFSPRPILLVYYSKDDLYKASYNSFSVVVKQSTSQFSFNGTCLTRGPKTNYSYTLRCYVVDQLGVVFGSNKTTFYRRIT